MSTSESLTVPFKQAVSRIQKSSARFTLSARDIAPHHDIMVYLKLLYMYIKPSQIDSLFSFVEEYSPLYGGREFQKKRALTQKHIHDLYDHDIRLSIPLSNYFFDNDAYKNSLSMLEKHHRKGNSLICYNDDLAQAIRNDFPDYTLKASITKNLNSPEKVEKALKLYDYAVIPMDKNDDIALLEKVQNKEKVILFGNAGCAYTCPARTCYREISKSNRKEEFNHDYCSKSKIEREDKNIVFFDIDKYEELGYSFFKMIPKLPNRKNISTMIAKQSSKFKQKKKQYIFSFPKCGRTWIRYALAHYINLHYKLDMDINLKSMFSLLPNSGELGGYQFGLDIPLIISDHAFATKSPIVDGEPVVFIIRSVYDTLVSYYFHLSQQNSISDQDIHAFIRSKYGVEYIVSYYNSWISFINSNNVIIISYEDMLQNGSQNFIALLQQFSIPVDPVLVEKSLELASFENMKKTEEKIGVTGREIDVEEQDSRRVRRGGSGKYIEYFNKDDIEYINTVLGEQLLPETKKLLEKYNNTT